MRPRTELEARIDENATHALRARSRVSPVTPKKALGQHFLVDRNVLGVIGRLAGLDADDVVLEVGPGLGVLTTYLADRVRHVHAVEVDRALEAPLRDALAGRANVDLVFGDALAIDLGRARPTAFEARREPALQRRDAGRRRDAHARAGRFARGASWCSARSPTGSSPSRARRRTGPCPCSCGSTHAVRASIPSRARSSGRRRTSIRRSSRSSGSPHRRMPSGSARVVDRRVRASAQDARQRARPRRRRVARAGGRARSQRSDAVPTSVPRRSSPEEFVRLAEALRR